MTSRRPCRAAVGFEAAMAEIAGVAGACAGWQVLALACGVKPQGCADAVAPVTFGPP